MCGSFYYANLYRGLYMNEKYMKAAIKEAKKAELKDEVPIGCVIVKNDQIIARGYNLRESKQLSIAHAEIMAIQKACKKLGTWRLEECELYVTLEPCPMCSGAIIQSRIKTVIYGASDKKGGCLGSCMNMYEIPGFNHYPNVMKGVLKEECGALLTDFFRRKRENKKLKQMLVSE